MRHMAEDLGYEYMSASTKEEVLRVADRFLTKEKTDKPMFFEVFTDTDQEGKALYMLKHSKMEAKQVIKNTVRDAIKDVMGEDVLKKVKKMIK